MDCIGESIYRARFISRPNRFVLMAELGGETVRCHIPNPGRMWELLFPGVIVYLVHRPRGATAYRVVGIERQGTPIMLDTHYSNDVAAYLIEEKLVPGWENWSLISREYTLGHSRFDLLLGDEDGSLFLLEVKSCTLFGARGAMFPDAITDRGRRHLHHLAELQAEGYHTGVLFLVQWPHAHWFLPYYHTDLAFSESFDQLADILDWKAMALSWTEDFSMPTVVRQCAYPREVLSRDMGDEGFLLVIYDCEEGPCGPGYYLCVDDSWTSPTGKKTVTDLTKYYKAKRQSYKRPVEQLRQGAANTNCIAIRTRDRGLLTEADCASWGAAYVFEEEGLRPYKTVHGESFGVHVADAAAATGDGVLGVHDADAAAATGDGVFGVHVADGAATADDSVIGVQGGDAAAKQAAEIYAQNASHLVFYSNDNPVHRPDFVAWLDHIRIDRLEDLMDVTRD